MNLVDMARRGDKNLLLEAKFVEAGRGTSTFIHKLMSWAGHNSIRAVKRTIGGVLYRGFDLSANQSARIVLKSPFAWYPFRQRLDTTGWLISAVNRAAVGGTLVVRLFRRSTGETLSECSVTLAKALRPVGFPCSSEIQADPKDSDLEIGFRGDQRGTAFLAVYRVLDRSDAISLCHGRGIEIGPGLNPQILPSNECDVEYVEEASPEKWDALYNRKGRLQIDRSLWGRYVIGEAYPLGADDESLDFIFSSHVFEHLANPLGYLAHWYSKLRCGGVVVGVVPDVAGSKDYVFAPCPVEDLLHEFEQGDMTPSLSHYKRWAQYRAPGEDPSEYLQKKRSIHVHFYTKENMSALLDHATKRLGYKRFNICHTPNHKDFYFVIEK